jgi:hypothetical protein
LRIQVAKDAGIILKQQIGLAVAAEVLKSLIPTM